MWDQIFVPAGTAAPAMNLIGMIYSGEGEGAQSTGGVTGLWEHDDWSAGFREETECRIVMSHVSLERT